LGLTYVDGGVGWSSVSLVVKADMLNGFKTIHGGILFAMADSAFAYACNSRNSKAVAQQASISFLAPAHEGETLTAIAKEVSIQGRTGVYNVTITNEAAQVLASFQGLSRTIPGHIIEEE